MRYNNFISAIENYYGNYSTPEKKLIMTEFIMDNVSEDELETLFKKIILNISSQYKTPPDVAMLAGLFEDKIEIQANNIWDEICKKASAYRDLVFADPCAFMAFKNSIGSLMNFSLREHGEEFWIKKRFIEMYKMYLKNPPDENIRPVMKGLSGFGKDFILIGDESKCKKIINSSSENFQIAHELTKNIKMIPEVIDERY